MAIKQNTIIYEEGEVLQGKLEYTLYILFIKEYVAFSCSVLLPCLLMGRLICSRTLYIAIKFKCKIIICLRKIYNMILVWLPGVSTHLQRGDCS